MVPNIFASIFYVICFVVLFSVTTLIKKTSKKINILLWAVVNLMAICCFQTFVAAIFSLIGIPINIVTLACVNMIAGLFIGFKVYKLKERQAFFLEKWNVVGIVVLGLILIAFILKTCTLEFAPHYLAVDAAAHLRMALGIVNYESVYGMFFSALHHAIFIELLGPLVSSVVYYKLYVMSDMLHMLFGWVLFYFLIQRYAKDRYLKVAAIIISIIYALGYPANSTLFGFTYLGMGVAVISFLMIVVDWFVDDDFEKGVAILLLSLGCLGIFESYVLFMPITFFAILFVMFFEQFKKKKLFSVETIKYGLSIFLIPTILGLLYTYMGTFNEETNTTVSSAIANEGGIYKDLFSNFAILIPFVLFAFVNLVREKKNKLVLWILPLLLGFMFVLLYLGVNGKVSSYYYYKNYYLLWLFAFELFFIGVSYFNKELRLFLSFALATWSAVLVAFVINIETAIYNKAPMFISSIKAGTYNDIYGFNRDAVSLPCFSGFKLELFRYVGESIDFHESAVAIASSWEDWYWYEVITGQSLDSGYYHWMFGEGEFFDTLYKDADYVIVCYDSLIYQNNVQEFETLEVIKKNEAGAIYKVKEG